MKKIYSKLTVNRREEFQIETSIQQGSEGKRVYKRALSEKARSHVNSLCAYYEDSSRKDRLCPVHSVKDGEVYFDFISGSSLNEELLHCLVQQDKEAFLQLLQEYRRFVEDGCELCERPTAPDPACEKVFGTSTWDFPGTYGRYLNIDLCFDNIMIRENQWVVIDYEWVFPMVLPVNFVLYRGIWALYVKNAENFQHLYTWQELYESMGMTEAEVTVYQGMNDRFNDYVYGGSCAYNRILPQYAKKTHELGEAVEPQGFLLQVYAESGKGYSEEESRKMELSDQQVSQELDVSMFAEAATLRIDPCHVPCVCRNMKVVLWDNMGQSYELQADQSNGFATQQGLLVFVDEDPQMIYQKIWQGEPQKLRISYDLQCVLQGEELERYRSLVAENAKAREGWNWFEQEAKQQQDQIWKLQERNRELEQELAKPLWKKVLHR